ncbi:fimbrial protein [Escherichia coli]|nr:fimbrial protein [Escherichia coli]
MLPSETMIWQPEFTDKTLSRKPGAVQNELTLDGATFSAQTTLNNGTNTIPFQARYYAIGEATPGAANADATFKVQYQ